MIQLNHYVAAITLVQDREKFDDVRELDTYMVNFGPQHPAAHGVLRLILEMAAEVFFCII